MDAHWRPGRIGGGGFYQSVVLCSSNPRRAYAWSDIGGVFRSDDAGATWRPIHAGFPALPGANEVRTVLADPRDPDRLLAAAGSEWFPPVGILASLDGGATWALVARMPFHGNGPFRWAGTVLARCPSRPDALLAGSAGDGVWRSADNGRTWTRVGLEGVYPVDVRYDRRRASVAWLSAHETTGRSGPLGGGLFRTEDGGVTWRRVADEAPHEIVQDPVEPLVLHGVFGARDVRSSHDGGETWTDASEGLPRLADVERDYANPRRFQALAAGPDFLLAVSARGDVWRRWFREASWTRIERASVDERDWWGAFRNEPGEFRRFGAGASSLVVDPADPDRWFLTDWFAIWETRDAGRRWRLSVEGAEGSYVHALAQDPTDPRIVHVGLADHGYFRSEDGGETFHSRPFPGGGSHVRCLAVAWSDPRVVWAAGSDRYEEASAALYVSADRGLSWRRLDGPVPPAVESAQCLSVAVAPDGPGTAYAAFSGAVEPGGGGVWHTADGGAHWLWAGDGLPQGEPFFRWHVFDWRGSEVAAGPGGTVVAASRLRREVWFRPGPGARWRQARIALPEGGIPLGVAADPFRAGVFLLCALGAGVYRSGDGGATWERVWAGDAATIAVDAARAGRAAAGTVDGFVATWDGGATWRALPRGLPNRTYAASAFAGDRLVAGTAGNGCFVLALDDWSLTESAKP